MHLSQLGSGPLRERRKRLLTSSHTTKPQFSKTKRGGRENADSVRDKYFFSFSVGGGFGKRRGNNFSSSRKPKRSLTASVLSSTAISKNKIKIAIEILERRKIPVHQQSSTQQQSSGTANKHDKLRQVDFSSESSSVNTFCNSFSLFSPFLFVKRQEKRDEPSSEQSLLYHITAVVPPSFCLVLFFSIPPLKASQHFEREKKKMCRNVHNTPFPSFLALMAIF